MNQSEKFYPIDIDKLYDKIGEAAYLYFGSLISFSKEYKYFEEIKPFLIIPEEPKGIEHYQKEIEEKFDNLIEKTKIKFSVSAKASEYAYDKKFYQINKNFESAKNYGHFPYIRNVGTFGATSGSCLVATDYTLTWSTPPFSQVGYYQIGKNPIRLYLDNKPNWLVRTCAKIFLDLNWKDGH
jgi:hypothetical protein